MATLGSLPGVSVGLGLESANFDTGMTRASRRVGQLQATVTRSSGVMRGAFQNIGFQVQDFAVQVAAGTSATRAFAQQAPQLLSGFGPAGVALGTIAAVAGSLASTVLPNLVRATRSAEEAAKDFEAAQKSLKDFLDNSTEAINDQAAAISRLTGAQRQLGLEGLHLQLQQARTRLEAEAETLRTTLDELATTLLQPVGSEIIGRGPIIEVLNELSGLQARGDLEKFAPQISALVRQMEDPALIEFVERIVQSSAVMTDARADVAQLEKSIARLGTSGIIPTTKEIEQHEKALTNAAEATQELTGAQKRLAEAGKILTQTSAQEQRFDRAAEMTAENIKFMQEFVREAERRAPDLEEALSDPFKNALASVQSEFTSTFESISRGAITSFQDVAASAHSIFTNLSANIASLAIFDPAKFRQLAAQAGVSPGVLGGAAFATPAIGAAAGLFGNQGAQQGVALGGGLGAAAGALAGTFIFPGVGTALGGLIGGVVGSAGGGIFGGLLGGDEDKVQGAFSGPLGRASFRGDREISNIVRKVDESILGLLDSRQEALAAKLRLPRFSLSVKGGLSESDIESITSARVGPIAEALGFNRGAVLRGDAEQAVQNLATALQTQRAIEDLTGSVTQFERQAEDLADQFADLEQNARRFGISIDGLAEAQADAARDLQRQQDAQVAALLTPFEALSAPLEAFQRDLEFATLNPAQQFARAQEEFNRIAAEAAAGSIPAIRQLDEAGQLFVNLAGQFGASPGQAAAVEAVQSSVSEVLARVEAAQLEAGAGVEGAINRASQAEIDTLQELRDDINEGLRRLERAVREP